MKNLPKVKGIGGNKGHRVAATAHKTRETVAEINGAEALKMHVRGMSYRAIGEVLKVSHVTVKNYIDRELADVKAASRDELDKMREVARQRVEIAINEAMHILVDRELEIETVIPGMRGDKVITVERFKAVVDCSDVVIKGTAQLSALYGLNATKETKITGSLEHNHRIVPQEELDATMQARMAILREAQAKLAAVPALRG